MKNIEIEKVQDCAENAFNVKELKCKYFSRPLHFHPEIEIVLIENGEGYCFAGDGIIQFKPGSLYIFSPNIAHYFLSDNRFYLEDNNEYCKSNFIQFKESILPGEYKNMPGSKNIKNLINNGNQGLMWDISKDYKLIKFVQSFNKTKGFRRLINLYILLDELGQKLNEANKISSHIQIINFQSDDYIYKRILEYISIHFQKEITLEQIAKYAGMNKTAICRYFKKKTGTSIFDYLLEFRISFVKNQLANTDKYISEIAYNAGFNNIANFNTLFKRSIGYTPSEYRRLIE